ncbi:MAG TPA: hypothetical protein VKR58_09535, partial [Aquella sp.]|nr:hypothetical protein [Aquella sp.]
KVQMDTSEKDNHDTQLWYNDASAIREKYHVNSFPTFLIFSPRGDIVHADIGYKDVPDLLALCENAMNPDRQYYVLLNQYISGEKQYRSMQYLANTADQLGNKELAYAIAKDYIDHDLIFLNDHSIFTTENIAFLSKFTLSSKDKGFQLFFKKGRIIDSVINLPHYSNGFVDYIISKENIYPEVSAAFKAGNKEPDWVSLTKNISEKYGKERADRNIIKAKIRWFGSAGNTIEYTKTCTAYLLKYSNEMDDVEINEQAWAIFLYSKNEDELKTALGKMKEVIGSRPINSSQIDAETDTYANLLYKLGLSGEAIAMEHKAIELGKAAGMGERKDFLENLEKMKKGIPTWPDKN